MLGFLLSSEFISYIYIIFYYCKYYYYNCYFSWQKHIKWTSLVKKHTYQTIELINSYSYKLKEASKLILLLMFHSVFSKFNLLHCPHKLQCIQPLYLWYSKVTMLKILARSCHLVHLIWSRNNYQSLKWKESDLFKC